MKQYWKQISLIILILFIFFGVAPNSYASRTSTLPQPGVKSLGNHLTDINANFVELYRLIFLSEPGFTGLSGAIITSGVISEARIDAALVRTSTMNTALAGKLNIPTGDGTLFLSNDGTYKPAGGGTDWDLNDDTDIDEGFIPPTIARLTNLPVAGTDYLSPAAVGAAIANGITGKQNADLDLDDLADGSLTGSKVGMGMIATYITTGILPDGVIPSGITRDTELTDALALKQNADADLTTFAGISPTANVLSILGASNYAAIKALLDVESGVDFYSTIIIDGMWDSFQTTDSDLADLSDGSLTGSKVGTGISATNVTTGTLPDAVIPSAITRDSELTTTLSGYTTSSALTTLLAGKMGTATGTPNGTKFLRDDMTWQAPPAVGGDDWDANNDSVIDIGYLPTALATDSEVTTTLSGYPTSASLTTTLGNYVLSSALTTTLSNYIQTNSSASLSALTVAGTISSTGGTDGTRGLWLTTPNTTTPNTGLYPDGVFNGPSGVVIRSVGIDYPVSSLGGTGTVAVSVNGATVTNPNFTSDGDITVSAAGSTVTSTIKNGTVTTDKVAAATLTTSSETVTTTNDTTLMTSAAIDKLIDYRVNTKLASAGFTIANYLNPLISPAAVTDSAYTVSGDVYDAGTTPIVTVSLNNGTYESATVTGSSSPWTWSRLLALISGSNTIDVRVTASDNDIIDLPQVAVNYTPAVTPPIITGVSLAPNGTTLTLSVSEPISQGVGFSLADLSVVGPVTGTVAVSSITSGNGTDTWMMELSSPILRLSEEGAVVFNWAGTADGIEDGEGTDLAAITSMAVTNNSTRSGAVTYIIEENFEGTGYDGDPTPTETPGTDGTINEDYTTTALLGSQSLNFIGGAVSTGRVQVGLPSDVGSARYHMLFRINSLPTNATQIFSAFNAALNQEYNVYLQTNGRILIRATGGTDDYGATTLAINTTYHLWLDLAKGTGSNGTFSLRIGTDKNYPSSEECGVVNSTINSDIHYVRMAMSGYSADLIFDQILMSETAFTSVP